MEPDFSSSTVTNYWKQWRYLWPWTSNSPKHPKAFFSKQFNSIMFCWRSLRSCFHFFPFPVCLKDWALLRFILRGFFRQSIFITSFSNMRIGWGYTANHDFSLFSWIDPNSAWRFKSKMSEVNTWSNKLIAIWTEISNFEKTSPYFTLVVRSYTPIFLLWKLPNLYSLISDVPKNFCEQTEDHLKSWYKKTSGRKHILQPRRSSWKVRSVPLWTT